MKDMDSAVPDKTLSPLLNEFRMALVDEMAVAKRNSSNSAIPLTNGHKVASLGSAYQYAFLIDSVLNTPDGAPGDLIVAGKSPLQITIVSVEGLRIVVSVEEDLGQFVPTARLQTNLTILMRKLIERIENNASATNSAALRMFGSEPVSGHPETINDNGNELKSNQLSALKSALGRNLTVIWGPPGTGKTRTIGTIAKYLFDRSRSVLLVSHTNTAVDQSIAHVSRTMSQDQLKEGVVVRVGEGVGVTLKDDYPDILIKKQIVYQSLQLVEKQQDILKRREEKSDDINTAQKKLTL